MANVPGSTPARKRSRPELSTIDRVSDDNTASDPAIGQRADNDQPAAPAKRYGTRSSNQDRHPALDIGPNWKEAKRKRDAAAALCAQKKADEEARRLEKVQQARAYEEGIGQLAKLDAQRDEDEREEEAFVAARTARGYRQASSAGGSQDHDGEGGVGVNVDGEGGKRKARESSRRPSAYSDVYSSDSPSEPHLPSESDAGDARPTKKVSSQGSTPMI